MADLVVIGRILKAHGLRGDVVIAPAGGDSSRFAAGTGLFLDAAGSEPVCVARWDAHGGTVLARFEGYPDRTTAEELAGRTLYQEAGVMPELPEGEYYHFQLIGLVVTRADGSPLGRISAVWELPGNDLFEVEGSDGSWLIPGRKEFVAWIDLQKGEMRLTDRDDLLQAQRDRGSASPS